jgi:predicted Zn-dependent protease with MMP-like domain
VAIASTLSKFRLVTCVQGTLYATIEIERATMTTFDEQVRAALDSLPAHLASALQNIAVVVEDENPEDPDLFGLYHGVPLPERGDMGGMLPDKISIYRIPLEETFSDPEELREEIRITVLHELAHYFGLDEERIAELGYD